MKANKQLARKLKQRFDEKQNEMDRRPAVMGDGAGNLYVAGFDSFIYVRIDNKAVPVFNNRVPPQSGVLVWVGYAAEEPTLFQVLSTRSESPAGVQTGFVGYAPARRYEWMARNGGQDPLSVHLRAFTPLKLSVSPEGWMFVDLYRGFVYSSGAYIAVPRQNIDLYAQIPTTAGKAAFVLITINTAGAVVQTKGSEVNIEVLAITDIPAVPTGTAFVCGAVRVYYGQLEVQEGRTNTDFVDLRFPGYAGGGLWQPLDSDLTAIAALSPVDDDVIQRKAGSWVNRTISQLVTDVMTVIDSVYVALTGNQTIAGVKTFSSDPIIPDEAYDATAWDGSLEPPTKNAVRDKIESMSAGGIADAPNDGVYYGRRNLGWTNLKTYFDTLYALLLASTASNDFQVGDGSGGWIKKTLAEVKTILGLGSAAYTASTDYQPVDTDLTTIAALTPTNDDVMQRKAGAWVNRTIAQLVTDIRTVIDSVYMAVTGWNPTSWAGLTRVSATVFTTTTDVSAIIGKRTKLKFTDTTTKYLVVLSATFSAGVTTITTLATSDYAFVGNPSAVYYSNVEFPFGWPDYFNYATTVTGFSANPTTTIMRYNPKGRRMKIDVRQTPEGTSNATTLTMSLPAPAVTITNMFWLGWANVENNGAPQANPGVIYIASAGTVLNVTKDSTLAGFTATGGKRLAIGNIDYEW